MSEYFKENLLLEDRPLMVLPKLACAFGLENAIVIQQLYWLLKNPANGKIIEGERWIFNTYETWQEQYFPFWSERTLRRIFTELENLKVIQTCQPEGVMSRRKYYRLGNGSLQLMRTGKLLPIKEGKCRSGQKARIDRHSGTLPITETTIRDFSVLSKETSNKLDAGRVPEKDETFPAMWKPDSRTKEQKLARIKQGEEYPAETEFDQFLEDESLDAIVTYRPDLYSELSNAKWHQWKEKLGKWVKIKDWRKFVAALNEKIQP